MIVDDSWSETKTFLETDIFTPSHTGCLIIPSEREKNNKYNKNSTLKMETKPRKSLVCREWMKEHYSIIHFIQVLLQSHSSAQVSPAFTKFTHLELSLQRLQSMLPCVCIYHFIQMCSYVSSPSEETAAWVNKPNCLLLRIHFCFGAETSKN